MKMRNKISMKKHVVLVICLILLFIIFIYLYFQEVSYELDYEVNDISINERYDKDSIGVVLLVIGKYMQDFIIAYSLHSGVPGGHIIDSFNNRIEDAVKEMKEKKNNEEK